MGKGHLPGAVGRSRIVNQTQEKPKCSKAYVLPLEKLFSDSGLLLFAKLVREHMLEDKGLFVNELRHIRVQLPASAFLSGYQDSSLRNGHFGTFVYVQRTTMRWSQRLVAKGGFLRQKVLRMDAMIVKRYKRHAIYPWSKYFSVGFAPALVFLCVYARL